MDYTWHEWLSTSNPVLLDALSSQFINPRSLIIKNYNLVRQDLASLNLNIQIIPLMPTVDVRILFIISFQNIIILLCNTYVGNGKTCSRYRRTFQVTGGAERYKA